MKTDKSIPVLFRKEGVTEHQGQEGIIRPPNHLSTKGSETANPKQCPFVWGINCKVPKSRAVH